MPLDSDIRATADLDEVAAQSQLLILVVPAQHVRDFLRRIAPSLPASVPLVMAAKGIEHGTGATMHEVLHSVLPAHPSAILSGPTFAAEVAAGKPAAVTVATRDLRLGEQLLQVFGTPSFRPYLSDDPIGCAIGGAVKNVLAIACGIVWGRELGDNARAALVTRGLAEMTRLVVAKGGQAVTMSGLSGLGDLVLTCNAPQSRNCSLGIALGRGESLADVLAGRHSVTEGVATAGPLAMLARRLGVDMPIVNSVDAILNRQEPIDEIIRNLLSRPFKAEI